MSKCNDFIHGVLDDPGKPSSVVVDGLGEIFVENLRSYPRDVLANAFSIRMHAVAFRKMQRETFVEALKVWFLIRVMCKPSGMVSHPRDVEMLDMQMLKRPHFAHLFENMFEIYPLTFGTPDSS